jgi:phage recombination protein Bet
VSHSIQVGTPGYAPGSELYFTAEQEQMILKTFLGGATKDEAVVLLETVRRRRLDPFSRQVYFVKRYDSQKREEVWAIQTSIDGLRSIADRTGKYEGQTAPEWCGEDGKWRDVWLDSKPPAAARVGAYKTGFREPAYGIARYSAYVQTKRDGSVTSFWAKMPDLMLAKCAEALAIRKAFPEDTGGLYVAEEMGQEREESPPPVKQIAASATVVEVTPAPPPPAATVDAPQPTGKADREAVNALWARVNKDKGKDHARTEWDAACHRALGEVRPSPSWTPADLDAITKELYPVNDDIPF